MTMQARRTGTVRSRRALRSAARSAARSRPLVEALEPRRLLSVSSNAYDVTAASYLGGTAADDAVRGTVIQSDGTVVLAVNLSDAAPGGLTPTLLNGATAASPGALVRLSSDGVTVLSVTRLADRVLDLSTDASDNLYVAMFDQGFAKLNPAADTVLYVKTTTDLGFANVQRIDAGPTGYVAALGGGSLDSGSSLGGSIDIYDAAGTLAGEFTTGRWVNDVTIDEASGTVIYLGYRNATDSASGLPVQISYYEGRGYNGTIKYTGYDWSGDASSPRYINAPTNNMADTRGYRAEVGDDGLLYMAFESAGGNFIFRYDPFDINTPVTRAGGDSWNSAFNLTSPHITVFGRFDPATGAYMTGNEMLTRLSSGAGNTMRVETGNIGADDQGRFYFGGTSAWGLPLPTHPSYTFNSNSPGFNPGVNGNYIGGAYFVVMEPTLTNRLYTTRLTGGATRGVAARTLPGGGMQLAFGGETGDELYTVNPLQAARNAGKDGWYGVIATSTGAAGNSAPAAAFTIAGIDAGNGQVNYTFDASTTTDADHAANELSYIWHFNDGSSATGQVLQRTLDAAVARTVTLTVLDPLTGWSQESKTIGPPTAAFTASPAAGIAPALIAFDASSSTDPDHTAAQLTYHWNFGDGNIGTGKNINHTYARGGVFNVVLTVTDPYGATSTSKRMIGITRDGGYARRLDFQNAGGTTTPGYTAVPVALYDPTAGFGYTYINTDFGSGVNGSDSLYDDYHSFSKYPAVEGDLDGEFLIDVPNGTYTIIARFSHSDPHAFPGLTMEGRRVLGSVSLSSSHTDAVWNLTVTDGQINMVLIGPYWAISALEIIETGPALQDNGSGSFVIDPNFGEAPLNVLFNAGGTAVNPALVYSWDFGDGNVGSGAQTSNTYAAPGVYPVTLNVTGGFAGSGRVINFGGDYVSSSAELSGMRGDREIDADGDGFADDTIAFIPVGLIPTAPLVNVSSGGTKPSGRIYGGISALRLDNITGATSFTRSVANNNATDYIDVRDQGSGPVGQHRGLLMWLKQDFLGGAHAQRVSLDSTSLLSVSTLRFENLNSGRWVVMQGDQLYVSQATFAGVGTYSIDPTTTLWTPYNPGPDYSMNFDQAAAAFAAMNFTDVRGAGILVERDAGSGVRVWYQVSAFSLDANLSQATGTVTVIEPLPRVSVIATTPETTEGSATPAAFTVSRTGDTTSPLTITYTIGGTALANDYTASPQLTGSITIPAGSASAVITIATVDDTRFEPTETLSITLTTQPVYVVDMANSAAISIIDNEGPFVNWGGNYVSTAKSLRPGENGGQGILTVADFNNDTVSDSRRLFTFSTATPLSPTVQAGSYDGTNARFFGGASTIFYGSSSANFATRSVIDNAAGDRVSLRVQPSGPATDFDTAWLWTMPDFLDSPTPKFLGAETIFKISLQRNEIQQTRWLIGDGTNFYVSQQTISGTGTFTWTGASVGSSMWALYTPSADNLDFDQNAAVFDIPIWSIPVRAAGFMTDVDAGTNSRYWIEFSAFSVTEGNNPGPLVITGDHAGAGTDDTVRLVRSGDNLHVFINNDTATPDLVRALELVTAITVDLRGGNDTLIVDFSAGNPSPTGGITFADSTGMDTLHILGASASDAFSLAGTLFTHTATGGTVSFAAATEVLLLDQGKFTTTMGARYNNVQLSPTASMKITGSKIFSRIDFGTTPTAPVTQDTTYWLPSLAAPEPVAIIDDATPNIDMPAIDPDTGEPLPPPITTRPTPPAPRHKPTKPVPARPPHVIAPPVPAPAKKPVHAALPSAASSPPPTPAARSSGQAPAITKAQTAATPQPAPATAEPASSFLALFNTPGSASRLASLADYVLSLVRLLRRP